MNIVMFSNTFKPHIGGVARSIETLQETLRNQGHQVYVVAPEFPNTDGDDPSVFRVPAMQNFNGSDFSVCLGVPPVIDQIVEAIDPDIIHSHHPFLLGDTAMRIARQRGVPIVFTHHTMYEHYTHYVPLNSEALKRLVIQLATDYCNLCDAVIAPSESVAELLRKRGVETQLHAIPTGIDLQAFASGDRDRFRKKYGITPGEFVLGHVGRLAEEKNLEYLTSAVTEALQAEGDMKIVVVGDGPYREIMEKQWEEPIASGQVVFTGKLVGPNLHDAYAAMDLFAMTSQSETQGMVVAEAMAAGNPVLALDGPGIREVVKTGQNGELLPADAPSSDFAKSVLRFKASQAGVKKFREKARRSAKSYEQEHCAARVAKLYSSVVTQYASENGGDFNQWDGLLARVEAEWNLFVEKIDALRATWTETDATEAKLD